MTAMIVVDYTHVFDDVQFAIDVKNERVKRGKTQEEIGQAIGYEGGAVILAIEQARYNSHIKLEAFLHLCQLFDLHPFDYFDLQRGSTVAHFKKLDG
jgi:DNA-binding XRE family transcriptional regulator